MSTGLNQAEVPDAFTETWALRQRHFADTISFHAPSLKEYETSEFSATHGEFVSMSVTGTGCALGCDHCDGGILDGMIPITDAEELAQRSRHLAENGCHGILVSGGCDATGHVAMDPYLDGIAAAADAGLEVALHTGLVPDVTTAKQYADAGASAALVDVIGSTATIETVYHLPETTPAAYEQTLHNLATAGLDLIPHVVVGLHYGEIRGEQRALELISQFDIRALVLVVLMPVAGAPMADVEPPPPEAVSELFRTARKTMPETDIMLGCARPKAAAYSRTIEQAAIHAGFNGIAFPSDGMINYAERLGLHPKLRHTCCSL